MLVRNMSLCHVQQCKTDPWYRHTEKHRHRQTHTHTHTHTIFNRDDRALRYRFDSQRQLAAMMFKYVLPSLLVEQIRTEMTLENRFSLEYLLFSHHLTHQPFLQSKNYDMLKSICV